jgi:hypothetical protein
MKVCFKCKNSKPYDLFFKHNLTSDGYHSWCKQCCKDANENSRKKLNSTIQGRAKIFLRNAKNSALKRNQVFEITIEDIVNAWEIQEKICAYSGREMTLLHGQLNTVSIERIDSKIGYTKDNTILVCQAINRMKSDFEFEEFFDLCKDVTKFLSDENLNLQVGAYK